MGLKYFSSYWCNFNQRYLNLGPLTQILFILRGLAKFITNGENIVMDTVGEAIEQTELMWQKFKEKIHIMYKVPRLCHC